MKSFALALVFVCALVAVARAQQPCPGGKCPPQNYSARRGPLIPWKVERAYQFGTQRQTFRRGVLPWSVQRTFGR